MKQTTLTDADVANALKALEDSNKAYNAADAAYYKATETAFARAIARELPIEILRTRIPDIDTIAGAVSNACSARVSARSKACETLNQRVAQALPTGFRVDFISSIDRTHVSVLVRDHADRQCNVYFSGVGKWSASMFNPENTTLEKVLEKLRKLAEVAVKENMDLEAAQKSDTDRFFKRTETPKYLLNLGFTEHRVVSREGYQVTTHLLHTSGKDFVITAEPGEPVNVFAYTKRKGGEWSETYKEFKNPAAAFDFIRKSVAGKGKKS